MKPDALSVALLSGFCSVVALCVPQIARAQAATSAPGVLTSLDTSQLHALRYRMIGPARGGRVTTVTGVPQEPMTFYMGASGGGVWKTTNAGITWTNISDGYFASASMGSIDVADSDPNVIYAGTGSEDCAATSRSAVGYTNPLTLERPGNSSASETKDAAPFAVAAAIAGYAVDTI